MSDAELCKQIYDTLGTYITANASQAEWMHGAAKWRENVRESIKFQLPQLTPPEPSVEEVVELARAKWPDVDFEVIYRSWFDDGRHPWIFATNYMSPGINISAPTLAQLAAKLKEPPHEST